MASDTSTSDDCYDHPLYWDLAFEDETQAEADFIQAVVNHYCNFPVNKVLEPGCGGGRQLVELSRRGFQIYGYDLSAAAVEYARSRLSENQRQNIFIGDMTTYVANEPVDLAYCFVNTFRHLFTEQDARQHLINTAASLRPGGLYLVGLHLMPPDADEEDEEEWTAESEDIHIDMRLQVMSFDREARLETLRFWMDVQHTDRQLSFQTDYQMRIYDALQIQDLVDSVAEFELAGVYDFWYDIDEPQELSDEMGDTVLVLRKREV